MTAEKKPHQIDAVAARGPCRVEKKVATSAGSAEPVKIPVMFYAPSLSILINRVAVMRNAYVNKTKINLYTVQHGGKGRHEHREPHDTSMTSAQDLLVSCIWVDVFDSNHQY